MPKNKLPNADIWPKILEVSDRNDLEFSNAFLFMINKLKRDFNNKEFMYILKIKNIQALDIFLNDIKFDTSKLESISKKVLLETFEVISKEYNFNIVYKSEVDIKERTILKYIKKFVGDLITEVGKETINAIKEIIKVGWKQEILPEELYKQITQTIGLDIRRKNYLFNTYRHQLIKDEDLLKKYPDKNKWIAEINRLTNIEYRRLLLDRGRTIGRTECINLANEGSRKMYENMAESDKEIKDNYELLWILTPDDRLCNNCREMRNQRCSFDSTFSNGLRRPTLHPRCRCCIVCVPKK